MRIIDKGKQEVRAEKGDIIKLDGNYFVVISDFNQDELGIVGLPSLILPEDDSYYMDLFNDGDYEIYAKSDDWNVVIGGNTK